MSLLFAVCGRCAYVAYVGGIGAPSGERAEKLQERIAEEGKGPGLCPGCKQLVLFRRRDEYREVDEARAAERDAVV